MIFDIIEVSDEYYKSLTYAQRQVLRTAQKRKNELMRKAEKDIAFYKRTLYTRSVQTSSLLEQKTRQIEEDLEYEIEVLKDQLLFDMERTSPVPGGGGDYSDAPYKVDFTLSYTYRYAIVRDYYMDNISDPYERVELYLKDEIAKVYLGRYYNSLYNVLLTYC